MDYFAIWAAGEHAERKWKGFLDQITNMCLLHANKGSKPFNKLMLA